MEALSKRFDDRGLPWELLYADDLVLLADSEEEFEEEAAEMEEWIGGKGIEGKCRENESHEMWSWSPESSWFQKVPLWGVW